MELKTPSFYEFGPFRLEPAEQRLIRDGQPVLLAPKAFELLIYLVENHGRLVIKDQIMQAVWPGSFVEDANLTVAISALRKALGKTDDGQQYIETVPKKGYRFTASVREAKNPEVIALDAMPVLPEAMRRVSWRYRIAIPTLAVLACVLALTGYLMHRMRVTPAHTPVAQHSLAILPLRNLRHDPDNDFLGFSLADAIITKLASVSSLTVRPSSAVEKYRGQTIDPPKVAAELNVDTLLAGNFIRDGDDLRITYQLIDVKTDRILGRDTIDLKYHKLLTVQDNVARQIIKGLQLKLSPSEAARIKPDELVNPLAYEYYLRGVDLMASHDFPLAVKMLEKSAEIDPNYPLTWAYLGQSYTSDATFELGGREQYRRAQAAYERALALQPKQLETEIFLANLLIDTGKVEQAVLLLRDAIGSNSNDAAVHWELGYAYRFAGMLEQSLAECELARKIDPLVKANGSVLNTYLYLGQYDNFLRSLPDANESSFFRFYRGFGEYHQGKVDQAAEDFTRAYKEDHTLYTGIGETLADSIAKKNSDGLQILRELESKIQQRGVGDPEATYKIAQSYAALGDKSSATRMLRASIEAGFFSYPYFVRDPLLNNLRSLPEFPRLMNLARKRHEAFKKQFF